MEDEKKYVELSATVKLSDVLKMVASNVQTSTMDATAESKSEVTTEG